MKKTVLSLMLLIPFLNTNAQTTLSCTTSNTVCPCSAGVTAEYYAGYFNDVQTYFTSNTPGLTKIDPNINFSTNNWGAIVPPAAATVANPETYSTRWSGSMYLAAGTYTFYLTSDDASYLWFGSSALAANPTSASATINLSGLHAANTKTAIITTTVGCLYDYKVHYGENTGNNIAILEYQSTSPNIARQAVPQSVNCSCNTIILPVELRTFFGQANDNSIDVYWSTATELDNRSFTVSKSTDGLTWTEIGSLPGAGNSSKTLSYSLKDTHPFYGVNYYLLSQTDYNGAVKNHPMISVDFSNTDNFITVFPNPFSDKLTITSATEIKTGLTIDMVDMFGNAIDVKAIKLNAFSYELNVQSLSKGAYFIKIKTASRVIVKKLVKN